jgi:hypothetical protein
VASVFAGLASVIAGWAANAAGLSIRESGAVASLAAGLVFTGVRALMTANDTVPARD